MMAPRGREDVARCHSSSSAICLSCWMGLTAAGMLKAWAMRVPKGRDEVLGVMERWGGEGGEGGGRR